MSSGDLKAAVRADSGARPPAPPYTTEDLPTESASASPKIDARSKPTSGDTELDSITATRPRVRQRDVAPPLAAGVEIRTGEGDGPIEEIEAKTLTGADGGVVSSALSAAAPARSEADEDDATVTTEAPVPDEMAVAPVEDDGATVTKQAPMPARGSAAEWGDDERIRISPKSLMESPTRPASANVRAGAAAEPPYGDPREAPTQTGLGEPRKTGAYSPEDSVTSRALARAGTHEASRRKSSSARDAEPDSITAEAPGQLTNMLRVLASDTARPPVAFEDDEPAENKTAVMPNAPVKLSPGPDSGQQPVVHGMGLLRLPSAPAHAISPSAMISTGPRERASDGHIHAGRDPRASGEHASHADPMASARMAFTGGGEREFPAGAPQDASRPPRYGLLVGVAAAISIIVPLSLYAFLNRGAGSAAVRVPTQSSIETAKRGDPIRAKAVRPAASGTGKHPP